MTNPIITEDTVTDMTSEYVDSLKRENEILQRKADNIVQDVNILAHVLSEVIDREDIDSEVILNIIDGMNNDCATVIGTLDGYNVVSEHYFRKEYQVTISVPVTLTMSVEALSVDEAEEAALSQLDWNPLSDYDLDYNTYYDAEIIECREV